MPTDSQRPKRINSAIMNRSGDITNIVERNEAACYLFSPAHTHNHVKKAAIDMPTKNIATPQSIGTGSNASLLLRD
jgi:hypothetical protein